MNQRGGRLYNSLQNNSDDDNFKKVSSGWTRRNVIGTIIGGAIFSIPILGEVYARFGAWTKPFPTDPPFVSQPTNWQSITHVTLVFHGAGGQDSYTKKLMETLQQLDKDKNNNNNDKKTRFSSMMEWSDLSADTLQASFNGQRLGRMVGRRLLELAPNLQQIHFIGISVGSFAANSAINEIVRLSSNKQRPYIQLTLLDPFTQRGVIGLGFGIRNFGTNADYTQQFMNTDDPVPSTNSPVANAACFDITNIRPSDLFGHDWPVVYYANLPFSDDRLGIVPTNQQLPKGTVITVNE